MSQDKSRYEASYFCGGGYDVVNDVEKQENSEYPTKNWR